MAQVSGSVLIVVKGQSSLASSLTLLKRLCSRVQRGHQQHPVLADLHSVIWQDLLWCVCRGVRFSLASWGFLDDVIYTWESRAVFQVEKVCAKTHPPTHPPTPHTHTHTQASNDYVRTHFNLMRGVWNSWDADCGFIPNEKWGVSFWWWGYHSLPLFKSTSVLAFSRRHSIFRLSATMKTRKLSRVERLWRVSAKFV